MPDETADYGDVIERAQYGWVTSVDSKVRVPAVNLVRSGVTVSV
ncbi:hypothetical protein [Streptomyces sp. NPDC058240]